MDKTVRDRYAVYIADITWPFESLSRITTISWISLLSSELPWRVYAMERIAISFLKDSPFVNTFCSLEDVGFPVLPLKGRRFRNLSRLRSPVGFGAITGPVEMGVQKKDCRSHCPVRNDSTDPRGLHAQALVSVTDRNREMTSRYKLGTTHTSTISKLTCKLFAVKRRMRMRRLFRRSLPPSPVRLGRRRGRRKSARAQVDHSAPSSTRWDWALMPSFSPRE